MKVTELKYEAVINLGNYESERVGVTVALEDGDKPVEILQDMIKFAKSKGSTPLASNKVMETTVTKPQVEPPKASEPTEEPAAPVTKKAKKAKVEEPKNTEPEAAETSETTSTEEADEPKEEKPASKKRVKNTVYSRSNDIHKKAFTDMLTVVYPGWKKSADKFKAASEKLEGEEFLNNEAEVIPEFKDKLAKIIGTWTPS